jgi:hypothetical protein
VIAEHRRDETAGGPRQLSREEDTKCEAVTRSPHCAAIRGRLGHRKQFSEGFRTHTWTRVLARWMCFYTSEDLELAGPEVRVEPATMAYIASSTIASYTDLSAIREGHVRASLPCAQHRLITCRSTLQLWAQSRLWCGSGYRRTKERKRKIIGLERSENWVEEMHHFTLSLDQLQSKAAYPGNATVLQV